MNTLDFLDEHGVDMIALHQGLQGVAAPERLLVLLHLAGCRFYGAHPLVAEPSVRMAAIGGLPLHALQAAQGLVSTLDRRDALEALNLMYPASKATAFLLTGSLRNFQKLLGAEEDPGKEVEFRGLLSRIRTPLARLWPELFQKA